MTEDDLKVLFDRLAQESASAHAETRHLFETTAESLRGEIRIVAEAVGSLDEKIERDIDTLRQETTRGFAETQAMIKFSHAELDRRVSKLEQSFADLQARVERLETTTH